MEIFRVIIRRSHRVALIVGVIWGIFLLGHFWTPRAPDVQARVFLEMGELLDSAEGVPRFMKSVVEEGDVQEVYLNGNKLFYTHYTTDKSIDSLLDYYEAMYSEDREILTDEAKQAMLGQIKDKEMRAEAAGKLSVVEDIMKETFVRVDNKDWGGFATIVSGAEGQPDYGRVMAKNFEKYHESGMVDDLGDPKIVVAFRDEPNRSTQYFDVWPGPDFDQRNLRPRKEDDAPGYDVEDIPRPPGSRRLVTFGQNHGGMDYSILVYRGTNSVDYVEDHFLEVMPQEDWGLVPQVMEARDEMEEPEAVLMFAKESGREAFIRTRQIPGDDFVTTTVLVSGPGA